MRLTALCVCGTLLALSSLSWTTADFDEGDVLGDHGFGPCAATLTPEGLCRQGQDESTCPYRFSLPPLTVHLPQPLRELEKIVKDLQKLKDSVDQLRKMCADCTVSQTERECGRQREREQEKLNEGTDRCKDERICLNERNSERLKDSSQECRTDRVNVEKNMEGDGDPDIEKRTMLEEKARNNWEAERESDKSVVKVNEKDETLKEVAEKDGKTQTEGAKGKDKLGQAKVPTPAGNEGMVDMVKQEALVKNNKETDTEINNKKDSEGDRGGYLENEKERKITSNVKNKDKTLESNHHVWRDETKETEKKTQTEEDRGGDGTKMFKDHDEHTNKERKQQGEERKKEMEKGIKVDRNNEKPKQTESIGRAEKEKIVKEGEGGEEGEVGEDSETGKQIKTEGEKTVQSVQRDSDGELASSKAIVRTDFVSISPTPHSSISLAPRHDSTDSNEAISFTSSLPSSTLFSSTSHLIMDLNQVMKITADGLPTQSTGRGAAGISEQSSPDAEGSFRTTRRPTTATISTLGGRGQKLTSTISGLTSTASARQGQASFQDRVSPTTATTTTIAPRQNLYTTTFPGVADRSHWAAKKNTGSSSKTGVKPLPGQGPKPGEKHKPAIKPEADQKLKNPKNDHKPDEAPMPHKKNKPDQRPTSDQKTKPGRNPKRFQVTKPDQRPQPDNAAPDLRNSQIPKHDQEHTTDKHQLPVQKPKSHQKSVLPVHRPTSHQRPKTVNSTGPHKDPVNDHKTVGTINQNSKPQKKLIHLVKTNKPDQRPHKKLQSEDKTKPDQRSTVNQYHTHVQVSEPERSETTSLKPRLHQNLVTELTENSDENPSTAPKSVQDSTPGPHLIPDSVLIKPRDQKPKPSYKNPKISQKPKPGQASKLNQKHPELITDQKAKLDVKPKPEQNHKTYRKTDEGLKAPLPDQMPNLNPESVSEAESNKTSKPRPPPRLRPPTRPTVKPGATLAQMPKPAEQLKPSQKAKTDLDAPQISGTTPGGVQHSQTNIPPAPGPVTQIAEVTHSPGGSSDFSHRMIKTTTEGPQTLHSLENGPSESITMSPNSRTTSDLRPQTPGRPPSIPMTTAPNKIMHGILPSVITSTGPGSAKPNQLSSADSRLQDQTLHNVEETAARQITDPDRVMATLPSPSAQTPSTTTSPDLRATTPATSGPEPLAPESSTPSARELRVKINQVAAFLNNSLSPNGRRSDWYPEHPEDHRGGSKPDRTDSKLPTLIPSKVTTTRRDCSDHLLRGQTQSGVYLVTPDLRSRSFPVFCDMELDGGGWTLLQRRRDGSVNFNRTWAEYRSGFGELDGGEFWLGNSMIHLLTRDRDMVLRVELEDFDGVVEYAEYKLFRVASERIRYRLTVGGYTGTAGDALRFSKSYDHNNRAFTTPDRDHDRYPSGNCGAYYSSGWWFDACMAANLNGRYYVGRYKGVRDGIYWGTWHSVSTESYPTNDRQSFKSVSMMIRPRGFTP